jgi:hypothetical protein
MSSILLVAILTLTMIVIKVTVTKSIDQYRIDRLVANEKALISFFRIKKEIERKDAKLSVSDSGEITVVNWKLN